MYYLPYLPSSEELREDINPKRGISLKDIGYSRPYWKL